MKKIMIKLNYLLLAVATIFLFNPAKAAAQHEQEDTLFTKISSINGVVDLQRINSFGFKDKYVLKFEQPIDHKNPEKGKFGQRVFVMNAGVDRPTVIATEGYGAAYASNPRYRDEISKLLDANIIFVEHRYFLESVPDPADWKYLTAENSAYDLHRITTAFKEIYKNKWIATGISKGGQTALIYRAFFPDDVDITVPYVAPLCKSREDGRHEPFLRDFAGTQEDRAKLEDLQREILLRRGELQPKFDTLCKVKGYSFRLPNEEIYDYSVLELPFSFWQWGSDITKVPGKGVSADSLFKYWMNMSSPDYFRDSSSTLSFFVQAAKELGYYGYDTKPFKGLLSIRNAKGYLTKIFLPEGSEERFDRGLYRKLKRFVARTDEKMMFIYGEFDPWSAVKVNEPKSSNVVLFVQPAGSHRARINTLPEEMKKEAVETLKRWISEE
ncbi:MAG: S28 family serine protease [Bacteroidales bacterium]|nr:S28 family serine protease [Bacteroidales bacterium]